MARPTQFLVSFAVALMLGAAPVRVHAAPQPDTPVEGEPDELFERAARYYEEGRYEEAAAILEHLTATIPDPVLFYNLARAYESAGELEPAIEAYSRYLETSPDAKDADAVTARIGRLQERVAEREAAQQEAAQQETTDEPSPPPPERADPGPSTPARGPLMRAAPWTLLGLGGTSMGAGLALALTASARNRSARGEPVQARAASLVDEAQTLAVAGNVLLAVGGAVAITGLTWGLVRIRRDRASKRSVAVDPGGLRF